MPKAYVVFTENIHDEEGLNAYLQAAGATMTTGKLLVLDDNPETIEGTWHGSRTVMIEFDSVEEAKGWYYSDAYQKVAPLRQAASGRATATNSRLSFYRHLWILHKIRLLFLSLIAAEKYLTHVVFDVTLQSAAILTGFVNRDLLRQSSEQIPTGRRIPPTDETTDKQKEATKCLM